VSHRLIVVTAVAALATLLVARADASHAAAAKVPHRIVSLSPTATESLYAIGAGKQVVAVDNQSDYPAEAPKTKLSGLTPNVEAIAAYRPDLVVISFDPGGLVSALHKLGVRVLLQPAVSNLTGAYGEILELGGVTGHAAQAKRVVAGMKAKIASIVAHAPKSPSLSVYHELEPDLYSATSKTFIGRIYSLFGLRNIADAADSTGSGYPQLSAEYVIGANPSLIVLADIRCCGQTRQSVSSRPGWNTISAVRNHAIVRIDDSIASRWGPRVVNFVRAIASALKIARS
jgi:iron complex transport system substrate-binding protein